MEETEPMCDECRELAQSMINSVARAGAVQVAGWRAPTEIIPKTLFKTVRLPVDMTFSHACGRKPAEVKATDGFDPAFSTEIAYSNDQGDHEHWCDRMTFAAQPRPGKILTKVAELQGYGTDSKGKGAVFAYQFIAPRGTLVRSTKGAFAGEVCFPDPIPYAWISRIDEVKVIKGVQAAIIHEI